MAKLKITRPGIRLERGIGENPDYPIRYSNCEFEVPGVGRLRTGERHPDFHLDEMQKEAKLTASPKKVSAE